MNKEFQVAGIGELLWDVFPNHKRLGGAPSNFAGHCQKLGAQAYPISCIGSDDLGKELALHLENNNFNTQYISTLECLHTGRVDVILKDAKPSYTIHENVAWDHIPFTDSLKKLARSIDAVGFGSLAQRSETSRNTIHLFLNEMTENALKIFDVNLRQNFFSKQGIEESLQYANILKLSDEELPVLATFFNLSGSDKEQLEQLRDRFDLRLIAFTRGPEGSLLISLEDEDDFSGYEVDVIDSVGAGDSFTAGLCMGLLRKWPLSKVNIFANKVAAFVCSQKGATPVIPQEIIHYGVKI